MKWPWQRRKLPKISEDTTGEARQIRAALDAQQHEVKRLAESADYFREAVEDALRRTR